MIVSRPSMHHYVGNKAEEEQDEGNDRCEEKKEREKNKQVAFYVISNKLTRFFLQKTVIPENRLLPFDLVL
jgi:hypothetical protein